MEKNKKGVYWYFILDVIFNLTIGLQLIIKSETITN